MSDDQLLARPIVILGAPRSGTTILSQLLKLHPAVYLANEPRILWKYGNDSRSDALRAVHATPAIRSHIRREFASQMRTAERIRLVEKTPSNSLRVEFVDVVLDDCVFVHVMRSGVESVLSIREYWRNFSTGLVRNQLWVRLKEMKPSQMPHYAREFARRISGKFVPGVAGPSVWGPRPPGIVEMARDLDLLEVCAWQWRTCVESACRAGRELPPHRYTECRLDELDSEGLRKILQFCQLAPSDEVMAEHARRFDASASGSRSGGADPADVVRVRQLIAPTETWLATLVPVRRHLELA